MARELPGVDGEALIRALDTESVVSIKLNRRKVAMLADKGMIPAEGDELSLSQGYLTAGQVADLTGYEGAEPVEWCRSGFYLPARPQFTLNPLLHAGVFYVQEASSMIYESLLGEHLGDIPPGLALDMCAAPGGKSTSILNALPDGWHLVANEFMPARAAILRENLLKWGYPQITVTNSPTGRFATRGPQFAVVAVDAPCSGEGMMRKEPQARAQWSPRLVQQCAALQREILADAVAALLPGGLLIYSTCTFNTTENEENVRFLAEEFGLDPIVPGRRFMPHITRGEGLFVSLLRKPGPVPPPMTRQRLDKTLAGCRVLADGYPAPVAKGRDIIPDPAAPLALDFDLNQWPAAEVDKETALQYLRHQAVTLPAGTPRGIVTLTYRGAPLGIAKNLGTRANNLYPKEWRIRNL